MTKILVKILLLILRLILKIAKIFSLKKLESFLTEFLQRRFDLPEEPVSAKKKALPSKGGKQGNPIKVSREIKRESEKQKAEESKSEGLSETDVTISRLSYTDNNESGFGDNMIPVAVVAGAAMAGLGIASIVRDKREPREDEMPDVEFEPSKTYDEIFADGFKKGAEEELRKGGKTKGTESGFLSGFFKGLSKSTTSSQDIIPESEYIRYSAVNRVGQPMDLLGKYLYNAKNRSIGIQTPSGAKMRKITEIILHCTATPEGREVSLQEIHDWHTQRGFKGIGYHYVIHLDGTIEAARPLYMIGAHCLDHNAHSIGISYVGGVVGKDKPKDTRTPAQKQQIWNLVLYLLRYFSTATVHGHYEYANKACPCFNVQKEWKEIMSGINGTKVKVVATGSSVTQKSTQYNDNINYQKGDVVIVKTNGVG